MRGSLYFKSFFFILLRLHYQLHFILVMCYRDVPSTLGGDI